VQLAPAPSADPIVHADGADPAPVILSVDDLVVGYHGQTGQAKIVVDRVSLQVVRGEVHGLIGESGSGKTQTAFAVLRLLSRGGSILSGTISFDGAQLDRLSNSQMQEIRGRRIAYIPQEPMSNLDPSFTIGWQLTEPMRQSLHISRKEARRRAIALLERVGIPQPERTFSAYPHEISGGMAQRVLIAGAVSCEPELIIADEPTTALDVTVQAEILDLLRDLQADLGVSILLVTHNFGVVADLCDRVSVMQNGRIVESGPVAAIFDNPQHPYTRSLFDAIISEEAVREPLLVGTRSKGDAGDR